MQSWDMKIGPQTFALWSLAVAGDQDEGYNTEDDELAAPRLFARSATWSAEDAGNESPWLSDAVHKSNVADSPRVCRSITPST